MAKDDEVGLKLLFNLAREKFPKEREGLEGDLRRQCRCDKDTIKAENNFELFGMIEFPLRDVFHLGLIC